MAVRHSSRRRPGKSLFNLPEIFPVSWLNNVFGLKVKYEISFQLGDLLVHSVS